MVRSILAVIAGSLTWMVTALGTDTIVMRVFPHWLDEKGAVHSVPVLLFLMFYSLFYSVLGAYVTALIANRSEIKHAFVLGILQLAMGIVATIQFWDKTPVWYHIVFLGLLVPANVLGGWLRLRQRENTPAGRLRAA